MNWVDAGKIRALLNNSQYFEKIKKGLLPRKVIQTTLLKNPHEKGEPPGTCSEIILYRERGTGFYAIVHQYTRPDGSIGASGKPDPKRLKIAGEIYGTKS